MKGLLDIPESQASAPETVTHANTLSGSLEHQILRSFQDAEALQPAWDAFVAAQGGDLYSSFDWCRIWWRHYGDRRALEIHLFRSGGVIAGIIPTFRETLRMGPFAVRLIRLVGCDHSTTTCGVVIEPKRLDRVAATFSDWLRMDRMWELMQWGPLAGYFAQRQDIVQALSRDDAWATSASADDGPHIVWDLPETYEQFLAGLHKKERSNIKICRKKLNEGASIKDSVCSIEDLQTWFGVFVEQHQRQWQSEGKLGHFADWPGARAFHEDLARTMRERGRLSLLRLEADGNPIGFQYNYRFGGRIHWLLGSRDIDSRWDTYSSGRLLHAETIERAIGDGCTAVDGLRGMYEYKLRLGGMVAHLQSITLVRRGVIPQAKAGMVRFLARLLDLFYYRIWFSRVAPKLPLSRSGLWERWIRSRF